MYFDDESKKWNTDVRKERAKVLANLMMNKIDKDGELIALEVGCGTGLISFGVKDKFKEIYCVDTSKEMLNVLKDKIKEVSFDTVYKGKKKIGDTEVEYSLFLCLAKI